MDQLTRDQIEDNIRYCEELLRNNPSFISEEIEIDEVDIEEQITIAEVPAETVTSIPLASSVPEHYEDTFRESKKGNGFKLVRSFLICAVIAFITGILITKFIANHTMVEGSSMEPALKDGDNLVVEKVSYLFGSPDRFDIIVFEQSENMDYIKRVIGLPGEKVRIAEGKIYINDKPIFDTYSNGSQMDSGLAENTITLGSDEYFVLGDNRNVSEDSRNPNVGAVKSDQIIGKAWLRVTPLEMFGLLH